MLRIELTADDMVALVQGDDIHVVTTDGQAVIIEAADFEVS